MYETDKYPARGREDSRRTDVHRGFNPGRVVLFNYPSSAVSPPEYSVVLMRDLNAGSPSSRRRRRRKAYYRREGTDELGHVAEEFQHRVAGKIVPVLPTP